MFSIGIELWAEKPEFQMVKIVVFFVKHLHHLNLRQPAVHRLSAPKSKDWCTHLSISLVPLKPIKPKARAESILVATFFLKVILDP
jgi:hypothetical protein